jgi:hypothetical protein
LTIKLTLRFTQTSSSPRITSQIPIASGTQSATRSAVVAYWFTSRDNFATCSCPSITIQLSKNLNTWVGFARLQKSLLKNLPLSNHFYLLALLHSVRLPTELPGFMHCSNSFELPY